MPHGKTKSVTAISNSPCRAKQKCSRQNQNAHGETKKLTAKPKTSRQNQKPHGKTKNSRQKQKAHGKTKKLTANQKAHGKTEKTQREDARVDRTGVKPCVNLL